jgi:PAS domain S-box-containing protein
MSGNPLPNHANKPGLPAGQGEKLYQALFYGSPEPIIIYDRNAVILALNPVAAENLGASIEACIGRSLQEFVPEMYDLVRQRIAQVITTGKTLRVEDWVDLHDGRRCFASTLQLIRDFHNGEDAVQAIAYEITAQRQAEAAKQQSDSRYRALYEDSPVMMHSIDCEGRLVDVSNFWLRKLGYSREEVIGRKSVDFLTDDSRRKALEVDLPEYFKTGKCEDVFYQFVCKDGRVIDILMSAIAEYDENGNFMRSLAVLNDITERRKVELALQASEARFRMLYEKTPVMMHACDCNLKVLDVSNFWLHKLGYSREEVIGRKSIEFVTEESHRQAVEEDLPKYFKTGKTEDVFYQFVCKDGTVLDILLSAIAERDEEGNFVRSLAVLEDVTERRQAERALKESEARFRALYEETPAMMHSIDCDGNLISVSNYWLFKLGYERAEVIGKKSVDFLTPASRHYVETVTMPAFLRDGVCSDIPLQFVCKDGKVLDVLLSAIAEYDEDGNYRRFLGVLNDVTEQKQAEAERDRFFNISVDMLCIAGFDGYFKRINPASERVLGYTQAELLAHPFIEFVHPDDRHITISKIRKLVEGKSVDGFENRYILKDGSSRWLQWSAISEVESRLIYAVGRDVTEQKHAGEALRIAYADVEHQIKQRTLQLRIANRLLQEEINKHINTEAALRRSEAIQRIILSAIPDLLIRVDSEGNHLSVMSGGEVKLTASLEATSKANVYQIMPLHLAQQRMHYIKQALATGERQVYEHEIEIDGATYYEEARIVVSGDNEVLVIIRDISDRKRAEQELAQSHTFLQTIIDQMPLALFVKDGREETFGQIMLVNKACEQLFGRPVAQIIGKTGQELFPGVGSLYEQQDREAFELGEVIDIPEYTKSLPGQKQIIRHAIKAPLFDQDGQPQYLICFSEDITDRKLAEEALWENTIFLETIMDNLPVSLFVKDGREGRFGEFIFINKACEQLLGWSAVDMIGKNDYDFFPPEQADFFVRKDRETYAGKVPVDIPEEPIDTAALGKRILHTIKVPLFDQEGNPRYLIGFIEDITDRKNAEDRLRQNLRREQELNRLKSKFVSITSHEFRNPLATINSATENLINYSHKLSDQSKSKRLSNIKKACDYMDRLLDEVLVLARLESGGFTYSPNFVDFAEFCRELVAEFEVVSQQKSIALDLNLSGDLQRLWLDPKLVSLALHNFLSNAIKFSPEQSRVVITVARQDKLLTIAIADQGIGIPAADLGQLFKSFHRASNADSIAGTGLGLSIAKQVLDLCGGKIAVTSEVDQGSTFTIQLPCVPGSRL